MYFFYFWCILLISSSGNFVWSFVYVKNYCVGTEITILTSISDGLDPFLFVERYKRHGPWRKRRTERCSFPPKLDWRLNNYVSRQVKGINRTNDRIIIITIIIIIINNIIIIIIIIINFLAFGTLLIFLKNVNCLLWLKPFPYNKKRYSAVFKTHLRLHNRENSQR